MPRPESAPAGVPGRRRVAATWRRRCSRIWLLAALPVAILAGAPGVASAGPPPSEFALARLQYGGGGDWYGNPSSLPNLLAFVRAQTTVAVAPQEARVSLMDENIFSYPVLYMTGHGNVSFSPAEGARLRQYLEAGGFLHADDNYGMDASLRRELARVFPDRQWVELPPAHGIFHCQFEFAAGLPKIHEHDGKPAQALALLQGDRIMVLYTYECDLGDGWEDESVHGDPPEKHLAALRMGANILVWALTH